MGRFQLTNSGSDVFGNLPEREEALGDEGVRTSIVAAVDPSVKETANRGKR